ncbi:hypothetical protein [Cupriavidus sp. amp6]|uniref:hypothetical protein n=1 Tax=Cupriavidus sp. amp6 TaxID=388051 RepID=UPI00040AAF7F|nr:hypothetical protein [Cupriavidus sp. amp6]
MPTLSERFDKSLDDRIEQALKARDAVWMLSFRMAKEVPESIASDEYEALHIARRCIDVAAVRLGGVIGKEQQVFSAAMQLLERKEHQDRDQAQEAKFLSRSMEVKG